MPKPPKIPKPPKQEGPAAKTPDIPALTLDVLILLVLELRRTNKILRATELNNKTRHAELLKAISGNGQDASRVTFSKVRREKIT